MSPPVRPGIGGSQRIAVYVLGAVLLALVGLVLAMSVHSREQVGQVEARPTEAVPKRIAYVPYWDQRRGFEVARQNRDLFEVISPVWYSLDSSGAVVLADDEHTRIDRKAVRFLQDHAIQVIPSVTNLRDGEWAPDLVREMLHDRDARRDHVARLVELVVREGYDGIEIDYEHLRADDRDVFTTFIEDLAGAMHAEGKVLTVALHPKTSEEGVDERNEAQDFQAIGAAADQVRMMTYDYSWEESPPGPVAPAGWVEEVIAWTVTQVPAHKITLGIVLLGYDWVGGVGSTVDYEQAMSRAESHGATVRRGDDGSPWFTYQGGSGNEHEVWFEDAESVRPKLDLVTDYGLGGVFFWRLGGEDPDVWPVLRSVTSSDWKE